MTSWLIRTFIRRSEDVQDASVRLSYGNLAGITGIACNVLLCVIKFFTGLFTGSISITADAVNNLSDASSGIITLLGFKLAGKPADPEHPYGHARMEYLAGLVVSFIILLIGFQLAGESLQKILSPVPSSFGVVPAVLLLFSIGVKFWMANFYRTIAKKIDSTTLLASAADSRNDVISTGAVLIALVISACTSLDLDGWMGMAVALFILYSGIGLIKDTLDPLLGRAPSEELTRSVEQKILSYEGILGTHDLMVHDYGPGRCFASVHVEMSADMDVMKSHDIIDTIERDFHEQDNIHLVIHYDPIETGSEAVGTMREWLSSRVQAVSPDLSIHDFRMVKGESHTNLIFDVAAPSTYEGSDQALKNDIEASIRADAKGETYYCVITVDRSYAPYHQDDTATSADRNHKK